MREFCGRTLFLAAVSGLLLLPTAEAARILNIQVESKIDEGKQEVIVDLLFDPGETAVQLELLALEFNDEVVPPLRPILSNNASARSAAGQYVAKSTVIQENQQRVQKHTITVPLDHLKLSEGLHQVIYEVRVLQDGKPVEQQCSSKTWVSVGKQARVTGEQAATVEVKEIKPQQKTIEVERTVNGQKVMEKATIIIREPVSRKVQQRVPTFDKGEYSEVFAAEAPPEVRIDDPNIAAQVEDMQLPPWTPPRTVSINFATTRNIVKPSAHDASRFGSNVGKLSYGTALVDITVKKTHGERAPSQEPARPTPQDSFTVSQIAAMSEDDFF